MQDVFDRFIAFLRDTVSPEAMDAMAAWLFSAGGAAVVALVVVVVVAASAAGFLWGRRTAPQLAPQPIPDQALLPSPTMPSEIEATIARNLRAILRIKGLPAEEADARVRAFARTLPTVKEAMAGLFSEDNEAASLTEQAQQLLDRGNLSGAASLMIRFCDLEAGAGRLAIERGQKRQRGAALAAEVAGDLEFAQRSYALAMRHYGQAVGYMGEGDSRKYAAALAKHGTAAFRAGEPDAAADSFARALQVLERDLGGNHPEIAEAASRLAMVRFLQGDAETSERLYRRALAIDQAALGRNNPAVARDLNNLGMFYQRRGEMKNAEACFRRLVQVRAETVGATHPDSVAAVRRHAETLRALGRRQEATQAEAQAAVRRRQLNRAPDAGAEATAVKAQ